MKQLLILYLEKDSKRDALFLGIFAAGVIIIGAAMRHQFNFLAGIGHIHLRMLQFWVVWNVMYTLMTAFTGYRKSGMSYSTMLLPASMNEKFTFTAFRVFILIPAVSLLILFILGETMAVTRIPVRLQPEAPSIWDSLLASGYILHQLPVAPFMLILFTSLAMALKTVPKRGMAIAIPFALAVCAAVFLFGPYYTERDFNYPFIWGIVEVNESSRFSYDTISEIISWTSLPARLQRAISYAYLLSLPAALIVLSYYRYKEMEIEV